MIATVVTFERLWGPSIGHFRIVAVQRLELDETSIEPAIRTLDIRPGGWGIALHHLCRAKIEDPGIDRPEVQLT